MAWTRKRNLFQSVCPSISLGHKYGKGEEGRKVLAIPQIPKTYIFSACWRCCFTHSNLIIWANPGPTKKMQSTDQMDFCRISAFSTASWCPFPPTPSLGNETVPSLAPLSLLQCWLSIAKSSGKTWGAEAPQISPLSDHYLEQEVVSLSES